MSSIPFIGAYECGYSTGQIYFDMFFKAIYPTIIFFASGALAATPTHFQQWYPQYGASLQYKMSKNCTSQYHDYLNGSSTYCRQYPSQSGCLAGQVVDCILDNTSESTKANMAAAAVLLGILPTILSLAGSTTVEIGLLSQRRPVLAFLLPVGSPAISPLRSFEYRNILEDLHHQKVTPNHKPIHSALSMGVSFLQYLVAIGAIANLIYVSWQLCVSTLCSFLPDSNILPALWIILAVPIHFVGSLALWIRVFASTTSLVGEGIWQKV
ncbi:hypothetical protein BJ166DRAFT_538973 [Pestalotiopsis sp. NC0098]|nr:hypothetical protein BJ166DRAFT_538973 [Pestalotiopsis sp. NC0098]